MFEPPVDRSMRQLRRDFFYKAIDLAAAVVFEKHEIAPVKKELARSRDLSTAPRIVPVRPAQTGSTTHYECWDSRAENKDATEAQKNAQGLKCVLLDEKVRPDG